MTAGPSSVARADHHPDLLRPVEQFLYREARLLDEGAFDEWLSLYDDDALYWVPSEPDQTDPFNTVSIMCDDKAVLAMRVARLQHDRAYALEPPPRTTHMVSNVTLLPETPGDGTVAVGAAFMMTEVRDGPPRLFSGRFTLHLRPHGDDFRIRQKRVDLLDCQTVEGLITVPF